MNENTMHHFLRRLRDNGQDYQADIIEREAMAPKSWTLDEIRELEDSGRVFVSSKEYEIKSKQLEYAIETVGTWISTFGDTRKETAFKEFKEELERIRTNGK